MKQPSDSPKSSSERSNDSGINRLIDAFIDVYLHPLDKPLKPLFRIFVAFIGSSTYLYGSYLIFITEVGQEDTVPNIPGSVSDLFGNYEFFPLFILTFYLTIFYALVIAAMPVRHGPIRLYLTGLLIPFITTVLIRTAWNI